MSSLGTYLRELREAKGVSLDEIARATRVGRAHLEALEAEDLAELPAPVFVKGFIRAYCEFLDDRPDEALSRYRELTGDRSHAATPGHLDARAAGIGRGPVFVSVILLVVLGTALFIAELRPRLVFTRRTRARRHPGAGDAPGGHPGAGRVRARRGRMTSRRRRRPPPPDAGGGRASPGHARAGGPADRDDTRSRDGHQRGLRLGSPARGEGAGAHLDPRTDRRGTRSVEELLPAGAVREWSAEKRFVLTVGNAGGIELEPERPPHAAAGRAGRRDPRARAPRPTAARMP